MHKGFKENQFNFKNMDIVLKLLQITLLPKNWFQKHKQVKTNI